MRKGFGKLKHLSPLLSELLSGPVSRVSAGWNRNGTLENPFEMNRLANAGRAKTGLYFGRLGDPER